MRRWFKFHMRKYFKPMPKEQALKWRHRLAGLYFFLGWNGLALVLYYNLKDQYPETEMEKAHPGLWIMRLWKIEDVKYVRLDNFRVTAESYIESKNLDLKSDEEHWTIRNQVTNENKEVNSNNEAL